MAHLSNLEKELIAMAIDSSWNEEAEEKMMEGYIPFKGVDMDVIMDYTDTFPRKSRFNCRKAYRGTSEHLRDKAKAGGRHAYSSKSCHANRVDWLPSGVESTFRDKGNSDWNGSPFDVYGKEATYESRRVMLLNKLHDSIKRLVKTYNAQYVVCKVAKRYALPSMEIMEKVNNGIFPTEREEEVFDLHLIAEYKANKAKLKKLYRRLCKYDNAYHDLLRWNEDVEMVFENHDYIKFCVGCIKKPHTI